MIEEAMTADSRPNTPRAALLAEIERLRGAMAFLDEDYPLVGKERVAEFRSVLTRAAAEIRALEAERDNWRAVVKEICDEWSEANGATCDAECDSHGHTTTCKATEIAAYLAALRQDRERWRLARHAFGLFTAGNKRLLGSTGYDYTLPADFAGDSVDEAIDVLIAARQAGRTEGEG